MTELKLITGTSAEYYFFKKNVLQHFEEGKPDSFIYLLPVNRAVRYFKQQLFSEVESKGVIDPQVFTFNSLVQKIFRELYPNTKIINSTIRISILNEVLTSLKSELKLTNKNSDLSRSIIRKIDTVINELKEFGYDSNSLDKSELQSILKLSDFDFIINKLNDFYNNSQFSLIDESALLSKAVGELDSGLFQKLFPKVEKIYISGYGIYTPPMLEFIRKIKSWCSVEILLEFNQKNQELFQNTQNAFEALNSIADTTKSNQNSSNEIEEHLYKFDSGLQSKIDVTEKINIQIAQNREQELCIIAAKIKDLHFNSKVPLYKIGVTFPNLEAYFSTIKSVFNEYEIPVNISTGYPLLNSHLIKSYLQVLKIVISGFSLNEIFKLFLSPYFNSSEIINFNEFKRIAVRLRLTHLRGNWQQLFDNLMQHKNELYVYRISQESIQLFKSELIQLQAILSALTGELTIQEFYNNYLTVLKKLGLFVSENTINKVLNVKESEKEFRAFNKFIQLFEQLKWILEISNENRKYSLKEFYNLLNLVSEDATYNLREWPNYGVQVMPRLEIQSAEPDYLFVGGLVEGEFPRKFSRDIFFNDEERALLGLNASEDLLSQDRFLFFQLLSSNAKKIVLSYPQFHGESIKIPSGFLSNLEKICEVHTDEPPDSDRYFSLNKIIENVSRKIHPGLNDVDINNFEIWSKKNSNDKKALLLEDLSLLIQKRNRQSFTIFEGNLTQNQQVINKIEQFFKGKSFSITALESFAFCPMQYFMQRILKLNEEEEIEKTMTPLERGSLIHDILFKFFMQLKTQKLHGESWLHFDLLNEIAEQEFGELKYQGLLWDLEKEIYFGNESQPGLWKRFLEEEKKEFTNSGFKPALFETEFGTSFKKQKPGYKSIPFIIDDRKRQIQLFGKIDRIDVDNNGNAIIYDYKTGRSGFNINFNEIFSGMSLQLPVYVAAAKEAIKTLNFKMDAIAAGYYLVKDSDKCERKTIFADVRKKPDIKISRTGGKLPNPSFTESDGEFGINELINQSKNYILEYTNNLFNGNFRHTKYPNNLQCSNYCDYKMVCRKDIGKLNSLNQLEPEINE
jgi:ATP-dependent helicase/nuclease subunit B